MSEKYLLFGGDIYYPAGGADDFIAAFDTIEAAQAAAQGVYRGEYGWCAIAVWDGETLKNIMTADGGKDSIVWRSESWARGE
jgi:hypothetical protein